MGLIVIMNANSGRSVRHFDWDLNEPMRLFDLNEPMRLFDLNEPPPDDGNESMSSQQEDYVPVVAPVRGGPPTAYQQVIQYVFMQYKIHSSSKLSSSIQY